LSYLLDTNICIAVLNGRPSHTRLRLQDAVTRGHAIVISTIVLHELYYGAAKSSRPAETLAAIDSMIIEPYQILKYSAHAASEAAKIRANLERKGTPIGWYDVLLAGQAMAEGLKVATANTREFTRVPALEIEDWTQ
jgi:tRNA(fMet)-specific endonuclease VapC